MNNFKSYSKNFILLVAISGGVIILVIAAVIIPLMLNIKSSVGVYEEKKINIREQEVENESIILLMKNKNDTQKKINAVDELFITKETTLDFIQETEKIAEQHAISLKLQLDDDIDTTKKISDQTFTMQLEGGWENIMLFLQNLETKNPIIKIDYVSLSVDKSINLELRAKIPLLNDENEK